MKVIVNKDACIGCGACMAISSNVFDMDDDGLATVIVDNVSESDEEDAKEAIESCPTGAIEEK